MHADEARELTSDVTEDLKEGVETPLEVMAVFLLDFIYAEITLRTMVPKKDYMFVLPFTNSKGMNDSKEIMNYVVKELLDKDYKVESINKSSSFAIKITW